MFEGTARSVQFQTTFRGRKSMSEEKPDTDLLGAFAKEARQRCDVIAAGLDTGTSDFEALRQEAHALHGTASALGLGRLGELAGLMESDLSEAAEAGEIRPNRASQISEAAEALAEGVKAAAAEEEEPPDVGRSLSQLFAI
jgi:HPt (histidine-containing phosphotransfer) domain-containing protein